MKFRFHLGLDGIDVSFLHRSGWGFRFAWAVYALEYSSLVYWMGIKLAFHFPWEPRKQGEMMKHCYELITDWLPEEVVLRSL